MNCDTISLKAHATATMKFILQNSVGRYTFPKKIVFSRQF